jgi:hypothetical protein
MALTVIKAKGKGKDKAGRAITFTCERIVTPSMSKGKTDSATGKKMDGTFPSFPELTQLYSGRVDVKVNGSGTPETEDCIVLDAIVGRNLRLRQVAFASAIDTPEAAVAGMEKEIAKMAKKFGISTDAVRDMLVKKTA